MKDRIEKELRSAAPRAERDFVSALAAEIPAPRARRSRTAFASAIAVMVLGMFASFGGVGYAAEGAASAADVAKKAVTKTSASDQYGTSTPVKPADPAESTVVVAGATTVPSKSTLPFTGLSLIGTVGIGVALFAVGLALRRRENSA